MKKILVVLMAFLVLLPVFSSGEEEQQNILKNLPIFSNVTSASAQEESSVIDSNMESLTELYRMLDKNFLWDIDHQAVYEAMAKAMFSALGDKYSEYFTSEEEEDFDSYFGQYHGIGIVYTKKAPGFCNIEQVYPNTPASRAGIIPGDRITHIDGEYAEDMSSTETQSKIRGLPGTTVTLTILRKGETFDLTVPREKVTTPSIEYELLEKKVGYIRILRFLSADTPKDFRSALNIMIAKGMTSLVIDLRNCGGGSVDAALELADMFIYDKPLISIQYKDPSRNQTVKSSKGLEVSAKIPVAILVNEFSASSSEILAATMKDNGRATLVGTTTFGKGIMQQMSRQGSKDEYLYTIAYYIPPSGENIHEVGVHPDVEVEYPEITEDEIEAYLDLMSSGLIESWVDSHPVYSKENVLGFARSNPGTGVSDQAVCILVRQEYMNRIPYDETPKADPWFDPQLIAAMDVLFEKLGTR